MNKLERKIKLLQKRQRNVVVFALIMRGGATKKHKRSKRKDDKDIKDLFE